jgi:glycine/D-amino acid oxidase-like deaminating enzyme
LIKQVDYIIVGHGLAGACLAIQLMRRGKQIAVFDTPNQNRASSVAAGIFNPITGKRIVKTWKADEIFSCLKSFYKSVEDEVGKKFYYPTELYTPFRSIDEQNEWMAKSADPSFSNYVLNITAKSTYGDQVTDPLGGILLASCGYVNANIFIDSVKELVRKKHIYVEEELDEKNLKIEKEKISYQTLSAQKIIFCTGIHQLKSGLFEGLPLKPLKGEVITIKTKAPLNRIYNRGVYVIESGNMEYKVGATYNLASPVDGITDEGRAELTQKVSEFLNVGFTVTHQDWGIRPSTIDRRPLLGNHPQYKNVVIFNGLGTKGVSLAPYFSDQLTKWLLDGAKLDREVNISRVKALYSRFD